MGQSGLFERMIHAAGQSDMFGAAPARGARREAEPTIRGDRRQDVLPGMEASARQAQAARDQAGPRGGQLPADVGLFGRQEPEAPALPLHPAEPAAKAEPSAAPAPVTQRKRAAGGESR